MGRSSVPPFQNTTACYFEQFQFFITGAIAYNSTIEQFKGKVPSSSPSCNEALFPGEQDLVPEPKAFH
jgi:hypothetical protein